MRGGIFSFVDWHLLTPVIILAILSLSTLFSISGELFRLQLLFFLFSFGVYILFSFVNLDSIRGFSLIIYIFSVVVLLFLILFGEETRGAARWVEILGIRIQFSEILKPLLAISLSSYLVTSKRSAWTFISVLILTGTAAFLIMKQPDLGNGLIYLFTVLLVLFYAGFPIFLFFIYGFCVLAATPIIWRFLHDYQKDRILTFFNPGSDPLGTSYNAIQAVIAVGSGMLFGKGLGQGTQSALHFLPERHTDFIFATLAEDFGLIGTLILLLCFAYLLYRIYIISQSTSDRFSKLFAASAFFLFLLQIFFNIGMNIGLSPVVGITLPFVSYGGSSILSNFIFLAILSSIGKSQRRISTLEIR